MEEEEETVEDGIEGKEERDFDEVAIEEEHVK